jgi:nickel/cobalt transporter (NicO) family protein
MDITLIITASSIGLIHTLLGPDHYLPFIALAHSNNWSNKKTTLITLFCGLAHCLSSVFLGLIGIALGIFVNRLESLESFRGDIASYMMIAFGLIYFVWAVRNFYKDKKQFHTHDGLPPHSHEISSKGKNLFWALFIVFILGPCEPLIPILMYPAAQGNMFQVVVVSTVFTIVTVSTMLTIVIAGRHGLFYSERFIRLRPYSDILASSTIVACGLLIVAGL